MFYYAVIDTTNNYVVGVTMSGTEFTAANLVSITAEQYTATVNGGANSLISYVYNSETGAFTNPVEWWSCSSDEVKVAQTEEKVSAKLYALERTISDNVDAVDAIDEDVTDLTQAVANKANANHSHSAADVGAAAASHTHSAADITGLPSQIDAYTKTESDSRYATASHTHSDYALATALNTLSDTVDGKANIGHTHTAGVDVSGLATVATSGSYEDLTNKPTSLTPTAHTHVQSDVTGLTTALNEKANITHTHAQSEVTGLTTALSGKAEANHNHDTAYAPISHTHAQSEVSGLATALSGKAAATHTHTLDDVAETTNKKVMTAAERTKLSGIATGANAYTHPAYTAKSSGLYKVTVDATGHISSATAVTKSDITGLGIPSADTTYNNATTTTAGLMSATDKTKLDGAYTGEQVDELLSGFASGNHTHNATSLLTMAPTLFGVNANGGVEYSYTSGDVLKAISAYPAGFHTVYAAAGCSTNPDSTESYRYMIHKTGTTIGWLMAWGSEGSLYINYQYGDNQFKGWRCLYDASPAPLWSGGANGGYYMTSGHTVTPSKKLSECRNGWILLWSDYDAGDQANNTDFYASVITKRAYTGQVWNGGEWYCDIPSYSAGTATDSEVRVIKVLQIYDAKIVGTANNAAAPRNDVVLRAVYEF